MPAPRQIAPSLTSSFNEAWKQARPHLLEALALTDGLYDETYALSQVFRGKAQLWLGEKSAAITEICVYPTGVRTLFWFLVGGDLDEVVNDMEPHVNAWAASNYGVRRAEFSGRRGWLRAAGYRERWTSGTKDL